MRWRFSIKKLLLHNWQLKLLSLFIAIILWIFAVFEQPMETTIEIPISYQNIPRDMIIVGNPPEKLIVEIKGPRAIISSMRKVVPYTINLGRLRRGTTSIRVETSRIHLPPGVEISRISPSNIEITLDKIASKILPVRVRTRGLLPPGLELKKITVEPSRIKLTGAESQLNAKRFIYTEFVDLSRIKSTQTIDVELDFGNLTLVEVTTRIVHVTIEVTTKKILKEFKDVPIQVFGARKYILKDKVARIKLYGPQIVLGKLTSQQIKAFINLAGFKKGRRRAKVEVDLPPGTRLVEISPLYAEVIIH